MGHKALSVQLLSSSLWVLPLMAQQLPKQHEPVSSQLDLQVLKAQLAHTLADMLWLAQEVRPLKLPPASGTRFQKPLQQMLKEL